MLFPRKFYPQRLLLLVPNEELDNSGYYLLNN